MAHVEQVDGEAKLDDVVAAMLRTRSEEIGVFDGEQRLVRGIINHHKRGQAAVATPRAASRRRETLSYCGHVVP